MRDTAIILHTEQEILRLLNYELKTSEWLNQGWNWSWVLSGHERQQAEETRAGEAFTDYSYCLVHDLESEVNDLEKFSSIHKRVLKRQQRVLDAIYLAKPRIGRREKREREREENYLLHEVDLSHVGPGVSGT
ncbi:hypothetical protein VN97_g12769 [Penicillium thymicola]|uniref:Uncharacterized protein n=1 Tax=Penicillium thymicola TaxID=293382 RepID=A0AAI9X1R4_PENTH|nr:hypothetical protein VN97_g12769 [Penicillium thymicola]